MRETMAINEQVRSRIDQTVGSNKVVLFMKGTPEQPQCGFSARVVGMLNALVEDYATANVLEDPQLRESIKEYSSWPTIPQLYVDQEFLGGCDIVTEMFNSGELHRLLGVEAPERTAPEIMIGDAAAKVIADALEHQPGMALHLSIDASWNHQFSLRPAEGNEIEVASNGVRILLDLMSAQRAQGVAIDMAEAEGGSGFAISNPNAVTA